MTLLVYRLCIKGQIRNFIMIFCIIDVNNLLFLCRSNKTRIIGILFLGNCVSGLIYTSINFLFMLSLVCFLGLSLKLCTIKYLFLSINQLSHIECINYTQFMINLLILSIICLIGNIIFCIIHTILSIFLFMLKILFTIFIIIVMKCLLIFKIIQIVFIILSCNTF